MAIERKYNSIESSLAHEISPTHVEKKKKSSSKEKRALFKELPFDSRSTSTSGKTLTSTKLTPDPSLVDELGKVLSLEATHIEKAIADLEKKKKTQELFEAVTETGEWGGWTFEKIESSHTSLTSGVEFLQHVLPTPLIKQFTLPHELEKVAKFSTLGVALLTALDEGLNGLALIYKQKILKQSVEILAQMKSSPEAEEMRAKIEEWEKSIAKEKENLEEEQHEYGFTTAYNILYYISYPLSYFKNSNFAKYAQWATVSASWTLSGLDMISYGIDLMKTSKDASVFNEWKEKYLNWQREHAVVQQVHKGEFEAVDHVIRSSQSLLKKRQAIVEKKIKRLKPRFHQIEQKMYALKEAAFIKEMQQILWEPSTRQEIQGILGKWGFYDLHASPKLASLLLALENHALSLEDSQFKRHFHDWMTHPTGMQEQFQIWFKKESAEQPEKLLADYVDHQETIEMTTRSALKTMIQKKHEVESRFLDFRLKSSWINFSVSVLTLAIPATLAILGLFSLPVAGLSFLVLAHYYGSAVMTVALLAAGYLLARFMKPNVTQLLSIAYQAKMTWAKLRSSISLYFQQAKEKKLHDVAKALHQYHLASQGDIRNEKEYQLALDAYKNAKREFEESEEKVNYWSTRLKHLEDTVTEKSWQDFALQADLKVNADTDAFDTLRSFHEALKACDLSLLSKETRTLLNVHMGLDLPALQKRLETDATAIQTALQGFFVLDDTGLISFFKDQQEKLH